MARVRLESLVSLVYPDVLVQRAALGRWADWADPAPLVPLVFLVMLDLLGSPDRLESKVSLEQQAVPDPPGPWGAATVSATRW